MELTHAEFLARPTDLPSLSLLLAAAAARFLPNQGSRFIPFALLCFGLLSLSLSLSLIRPPRTACFFFLAGCANLLDASNFYFSA